MHSSLASPLSEQNLDEYGLPRVPITKKLGEPVVSLHHIAKSYQIHGRKDVVRALTDISLMPNSELYPIRRGEFVMLRGPSGGGKTSLLNIIGTIDRASSGRVDILGTTIDENCSDNFLARLRLEKVGFVFQTFNLLATMSAFENVELPMTILGERNAKERKKRAKELLKMVGLQDRLTHLISANLSGDLCFVATHIWLTRYPSELSGGEQQRVTIARALANAPEVLLLDEPTGDLDTRNTVEIMDLLLEINQNQNTTCIMVTHNPDVECYADRILYVEDGRFIRQALNEIQTPLIFDEYIKYLNQVEHERTEEGREL